MKELVEGVYQIEVVRGSNVYLIAAGDSLALVDAGPGGSSEKIIAQLQENGFDPAALKTIFLTHAHNDHIGAVDGLVQLSGAKVMAYETEAPYLEGTQQMPVTNLALRLLGLVGRLFPPPATIKVDRTLADGEMIDQFGGVQVIHTPGHSPGSMCLYLPARRVLFTGDIMAQKKGKDGNAVLKPPIPFFTTDMHQAKESFRKLAGLDVDVICSGHWSPILQGGGQKIKALIDRLDSA